MLYRTIVRYILADQSSLIASHHPKSNWLKSATWISTQLAFGRGGFLVLGGFGTVIILKIHALKGVAQDLSKS